MSWLLGNNFTIYNRLCLIHISEILILRDQIVMSKMYFSCSTQQQKYMNKVNEYVLITFLVIVA